MAAGSSSSSLTSTSHTLTHAPAMATTTATMGDGSALAVFLESIENANRHIFLQPPPLLPAGSLELARQTLDAFAGQVSDEQQLKLQEAARKRKREGGDRAEVLKIRKLHVDGFETGQVWQQAKRIITSALQLSQDVLAELEESRAVQPENADVNGQGKLSVVDAEDFEGDSDEEAEDESGSDDVNSDEYDDSEALDDEEADEDDEEVSGEGLFDEEEDEEDDEEGLELGDGLEDDENEDEEEQSGDDDEGDQPSAEFVEDPHGLNDGFFSIDEFNKQSQWFEDQDARGDPNTDQVSDEEELDWHTDPMAMPPKKSHKTSRKNGKHDKDEEMDLDMDDDAEESEDDGPTFGNMDLYAPEGASEDEADQPLGNGLDGGIDLTANDIFYKDFFAPPQKKGKRGGKPRPRDLPQVSQPEEADIERAMDDVRRDLFDDISEHSDSEDALSDVEAGDPKSRRSAHERRQAKLAEEIRKLEAELVAKRAWTLSGEAAAVDRPVNSLLEEDLDFEHVGKPVPVMTEEVSESIEALIKRRILAREFDEVLRRRPDSLGDPAGARRGLVDVDDSKAKQSLAEIYEEEHVKKTNPDEYVGKADEKLRREEQEIERMWKEVSAKLDTLSSWHYKPKPAAPTLTVVTDVATISMEDAQPTTAQGVAGGESMLAPQEVYKAGKETAEAGEVVSKGGLPVARQEMSRDEKLRRRRREKERIHKAGGTDATTKLGKKAQMQKDTIADLKKGDVTVINRKGERVGMDGKVVSGPKGPGTSGSYKL